MFPLMILSGLVQQIVSLTQNISALSMMKQSEKQAAERHEKFMQEFEKQQKKNAQDNKSLLDALKSDSKLGLNAAQIVNFGQRQAEIFQQNCSHNNMKSAVSSDGRQTEVRRPLELIAQSLNWNCGGSNRTPYAA
ncbi:hypothetical protein [Ochrobactrum sp. Marseille-Q0166]|uniref:hypothetical protein n=1 Tax=Ochrobactrum sp. Marseille-Q0166 TaxID=2761105 RepID=UPI00165540BA|nr:hypothetical protein [Ochrobactrum sp. Marseille-Q0166]MBC8719576.1 hypothetical protein [Ochrobactrum sp. Marseille-Q0166]